MNGKRTWALLVTMGILLLGVRQATGQAARPRNPQGTYGYAFTYQGQLKDAGGPVNGVCDLRFILWNAAIGGAQVGSILTLEGIEIEDGLFTARLDFGGTDVHNGSARWLEVAVRCPAGSGGYVTLSPRQELTGAPAALSLALPFYAEANVGGPLVSFHNSGDGEAAVFSSQQGFALYVESAGQDGLYIGAAGQDGVNVISAGGRGLAVDTAGSDGVFVNTAHGNGVKVNSADTNGIQVDAAGGDGVYVEQAGNPSATQPWPPGGNGFEVAGAASNGLYVGRADNIGVYVYSANGTGVLVQFTSGSGFEVDSATYDGVVVGSAGHDGVSVYHAGSPSADLGSSQNNGFQVNGAQGYGLYVGRADLDGVYVNSTAWHGLNVAHAGVNGLYVAAAGNNGVDVTGNNYAGTFHGDINVTGNCIGCVLAIFGLNAGDQPLGPGQVVAIQGIQATALDNAPALWRVVPAGEGSVAVGVVRGKAELDEAPEGASLREGEIGQHLVPRFGAAQPGEYLSIVIYGSIQVKASAADGSIQPGTRLAVGGSGTARALKTVVVEGVTLAEGAPTIGIALAAPNADGLVWVLVNPQ